MSATDFDVKNYNTQELLSILNISHKIPLTKALIIDETQKKIDQMEDRPKFKQFFFEVRKKLLSEKDEFNKQNKYTEDDGNYDEATEILKNSTMKKQPKTNVLLDDDSRLEDKCSLFESTILTREFRINTIHTPGIYVNRIFQGKNYEKRIEKITTQ